MEYVKPFNGCYYIDLLTNKQYYFIDHIWHERRGCISYGHGPIPSEKSFHSFYIDLSSCKLYIKETECGYDDNSDPIDMHLGYGDGPPINTTMIHTRDKSKGVFFGHKNISIEKS